jgi:hypothetical protein
VVVRPTPYNTHGQPGPLREACFSARNALCFSHLPPCFAPHSSILTLSLWAHMPRLNNIELKIGLSAQTNTHNYYARAPLITPSKRAVHPTCFGSTVRHALHCDSHVVLVDTHSPTPSLAAKPATDWVAEVEYCIHALPGNCQPTVELLFETNMNMWTSGNMRTCIRTLWHM